MSRKKSKKPAVRTKKRGKAVSVLRFGNGLGLALNLAGGLTLLLVALSIFEGSLWLSALVREVPAWLLGATLLCGGFAFGVRRFVLGGLLTAGTLLTMAQSFPLWRAVKLTPEKGPVVRVAVANLNGSDVDAQALSALLREERPDVVAAVGVTKDAEATIDAALSTWPSRAHGLGKAHDRALWSRFTLRGPTHDLVQRTRIGKCDVQLTVVKLPAVGSLAERKVRAAGIDELEAVHDSARAIWLGSFGGRPQTPDLADLLKRARLRDTRLGHGLLATNPAWLGALGFATDHVLVRGWISVRGRGVRDPIGPHAHRTVVSTLELTEARCQP